MSKQKRALYSVSLFGIPIKVLFKIYEILAEYMVQSISNFLAPTWSSTLFCWIQIQNRPLKGASNGKIVLIYT